MRHSKEMSKETPEEIPMNAFVEAKAELRRRMSAARDALPLASRMAAAEAVAGKIALPSFRRLLPEAGGIVAGYMPIRSELDPRPLMLALASEGFRLALPRTQAQGLVFHAYQPGDALEQGPFGTLHPFEDQPVVSPATILTPLLAFDIRGTRLGYGKGYYDRAFAGLPNARRIGLGYTMQQVVTVPSGPHDAELDAVFTET